SGSKDIMREAIDYLKNKVKEEGVFLVAVPGKDGIRLTMGITRDLVEKGLHAGNLLRETVKVLGGGGGGRPDMAEAGGKNPAKFKESIEILKNLLRQTE
ncbi:MAG: alanine--tRNA ligase, partial [Caldiserica bacterium]|nr:alanine--tRNA ligase [Caldisericota bacterium]